MKVFYYNFTTQNQSIQYYQRLIRINIAKTSTKFAYYLSFKIYYEFSCIERDYKLLFFCKGKNIILNSY